MKVVLVCATTYAYDFPTCFLLSRLMATANIKTVEGRAKAKARREPYYTKVRVGCFLGFRKMALGSEGTWVARCRVEATGRQMKTSLGEFQGVPPSRRYDAALDDAEKWFAQVGMSVTQDVKTVKDACTAYVANILDGTGEEEAQAAKANDATSRFERWVYGDPIAKISLSKLTRHALESWRKSMAQRPVIINPHAPKAEQRQRPRSPATLNRDMAALRAALNHSLMQGYVGSNAAWLGTLRPIPGADRARDVYLTRDERRKLLDHTRTTCANCLRHFAWSHCGPGLWQL